MKLRFLVLTTICLVPICAFAQNKKSVMGKDNTKECCKNKVTTIVSISPNRYWYLGAGYSMPLMYGDFYSITKGNKNWGNGLNLNLGYKFSPIFAVESSIELGRMKGFAPMYAQDYRLGVKDAMTYYPYLVLGGKDNGKESTDQAGLWNDLGNNVYIESVPYNSVYSKSKFVMGSLKGVLNLNRLVMNVPYNKEQRLTALLKPGVYVQKFWASTFDMQKDVKVTPSLNPLSFGLGTDVAALISLTKRIGLELSTGFIWVNDKTFDGVKTLKQSHDDYIWNTSISLVYKFKGKGAKCCKTHYNVEKVEPIKQKELIVINNTGSSVFANGNFDFTYLLPTANNNKDRQVKYSAYVNFPISNYDVNPEFNTNKKELTEIQKNIVNLISDKEIILDSISIVGWASPDGYVANNLILSKNRAASLQDYIVKNYSISKDKIYSTGKGEDWEGLKQLVNNWQSDSKIEVLDIINSSKPLAKKKTDLISTKDFNYILNNFYPSLRRNDYTFNYTIVPFTLNRMKELMQTNPSKLSEEEMIYVINTCPIYSADFVKNCNVALKFYPNSVIVKTYLAAVELKNGNIDVAIALLKPISNNSTTWNVLGIAYALNGQQDLAKHYLQKATDCGDECAKNNLNRI